MENKTSFKAIKKHVAFGIFTAICAISAQAKDYQPNIVGGGQANPADWQFFTQLVNDPGSLPFCGASYIGNGYVLTAAHCVRNKQAQSIAVNVGSTIRGGNDGQRINVAQIFSHPQYNRSTHAYDVAVLKLTQIPQNANVVNLAQGSLTQYARIGDMLTVAGLGRLSEHDWAKPSVLQEVDVPLVSDSVCQSTGGPYSNVGADNFCAGFEQGQYDSCSGDSGGPIVVNLGGQTTQVGLVSWGVGCARAGNYGVYADVAAARSWIDSVVGGIQEQVSVGYTASQTIAGFTVGEIKSHTFSITNTGTANFTLTSIGIANSGVTNASLITHDSCSATTLLANDACSVSVDFEASSAGNASVSLNFTIDKNNTAYSAVVNAQASSSGGGNTCPETWQSSKIYDTGDKVIFNNQVWEAQWWVKGKEPADTGPWGVWLSQGAASCN
ncbi:trypsin-like serine protease [Colwellia asteriadis]|uniref:Trypsin-like serine protease n=1 Tax=Colwellia asteriadis TaxID=517723 RepID=A0ABN1LA07_9GAMM